MVEFFDCPYILSTQSDPNKWNKEAALEKMFNFADKEMQIKTICKDHVYYIISSVFRGWGCGETSSHLWLVAL